MPGLWTANHHRNRMAQPSYGLAIAGRLRWIGQPSAVAPDLPQTSSLANPRRVKPRPHKGVTKA